MQNCLIAGFSPVSFSFFANLSHSHCMLVQGRVVGLCRLGVFDSLRTIVRPRNFIIDFGFFTCWPWMCCLRRTCSTVLESWHVPLSSGHVRKHQRYRSQHGCMKL